MSTLTKLLFKSSKMKLTAAAINYHTFKSLISTSIFIVLFIGIDVGINVVNAEYFSSVDRLRKLDVVEMELMQAFSKRLELQEKELEIYQRFIDHVKLQHSIAEEDMDEYLDSPITAFTLIKRIVVDWHRLEELMESSPARKAFTEVFEKFDKENKIPDEKELRDAAQDLARLQKVFNINANEMAKNQIGGIELSWNDCFEIGASLFDQNQLSEALDWFNITLKKLHEIDIRIEDVTRRRFEIETLEYIALSYYELGSSKKAIEYIDEILKLEPTHHTKDIQDYLSMSPSKDPPPINSNEAFSFMHNYTQLC